MFLIFQYKQSISNEIFHQQTSTQGGQFVLFYLLIFKSKPTEYNHDFILQNIFNT